MYRIKITNAFKRDIKKAKKRNYDMAVLQKTVELLESGDQLPAKYRDHVLMGEWNGYRECHLKPDWLLIYRYVDSFLVLERCGSHADLFKM